MYKNITVLRKTAVVSAALFIVLFLVFSVFYAKESNLLAQINKNKGDKDITLEEDLEASGTREIFQRKLEEIEDENVKKILQDFDKRINVSNEKKMDDLINYLNKVERLLKKIDRIFANNKGNPGVDELSSYLNRLLNQISELREKAKQQKAKDYVLDLRDDLSVDMAADILYKRMKADLKDIRNDARELNVELKKFIKRVKEVYFIN